MYSSVGAVKSPGVMTQATGRLLSRTERGVTSHKGRGAFFATRVHFHMIPPLPVSGPFLCRSYHLVIKVPIRLMWKAWSPPCGTTGRRCNLEEVEPIGRTWVIWDVPLKRTLGPQPLVLTADRLLASLQLAGLFYYATQP